MGEAAYAMAPGTSAPIRVLDKYEIIRRVAQGGMGEIFLAQQTGVAGFNRLIILKTLLPELADQPDVLDQFLDEARIGATLNHPNIVGIHEIGQWEDVYFLVMEFIDGDTLAGLQRAAAKRKASIPWVVSAQIVRDTAKGLDHAHFATHPVNGRRLNIIHRDVTPQNIMVRLDGVVKVVDFGIAKAAGSDPRTNAGEVKGKLSYLSPEQISGAQSLVDHRADQFALGIVLWELCTGRRLFNQKNPLDIFKRILSHDIPAPTSIVPQVPQALEKIVMRMLAKKPDDRYARCGDIARDIQTWLESLAGRVDATSVFVERLIGEDARARLADLTPQPVTIQGLKKTLTIPCGTCGAKLPPRAKFCGECGTPTVHGNSPSNPPLPRPEGVTSPTAMTSTVSSDVTSVIPASVDELLSSESLPSNEPVIVESFRRSPTPASTPRVRTPSSPTHVQPPTPRLPGFSVSAPQSRTPPPTAMPTFMPTLTPVLEPIPPVHRPPSSPGSIPLVAAPPSTSESYVALQTEVYHPPSSSSADASFLNVPTPSPSAPSVDDRTMSMDDLFAVPGPKSTKRATPPPARAIRALYGRDVELTRAKQLLAETPTRTRALVFLGEMGAGKTALVERLANETEALGMTAIVARGSARGLAAPVDVIEQIIAHVAQRNDVDGLRAFIDQQPLPVPTKLRCRAAILGDASAPPTSGPLEHLVIEAAVASLLGVLAQQRPLVLIVDDLHEASVSSLRILGTLCTTVDKGVALIATADLRFDHPSLPLHVLPAIPPDQMARVLSTGVNGATVTPDVTEKILERSGANPAFATELLHQLVTEGGVLVEGGLASATRAFARVAMPPNAGFHTTTRVRCLGNATFEFLKVASSLGMEFTLTEIGNAAVRTQNTKEAADRAVREGLLVNDAGDRFRFRRNLYFHIVNRERKPGEIPEIHARLAAASAGKPGPHRLLAAEQILRAGEARPDLIADVEKTLGARGLAPVLGALLPDAVRQGITRLASGDGDPDGLATLAAGAANSIAATSPDDAVALATSALSVLAMLPVGPASHAKLLAARAAAHTSANRLDDADRDLDAALEALARTPDRDVKGKLLIQLARVQEKRGNLQSTAVQYAEALKDTSMNRELRFDASVELAVTLRKMGHADRARQLLAEAQLVAHEAKNIAGTIRCRIEEGAIMTMAGDALGALKTLDAALHLAAENADGLAEAKVHRQIAAVLSQTGDPRQGVDHVQKAAELARRVGWSQGVVEVLGELRALGRAGLM